MAARLAPPAQRKSLATLPVYLDYLVDRQSFANTSFREWIERRGGCLARADEYLSRVLQYYLEQRYPP